MDIHKIMELFGIRDDNPEELDEAMERQILPDIQRGKPAGDLVSLTGDETRRQNGEPRAPEEPLPDHVKLINVGRCPSCGDQIMEKPELSCAWCNTSCRPGKDGFHLVHVALGAFQERHGFCSDECFEAFRRMYPARVHRNCYERSCSGCHFCIKRYIDESDGFPGPEEQSAAKDAVAPEKA